MKYRLMQIASRQLLPNLLGWYSLYRAGLVEGMTLLHSDSDESRKAAYEILFLTDELVEKNHGDAEKWSVQEVDATAQSVYLEARECIEEDPQARWILNATGGNKPMSLGLHHLASHPQVLSVIYREKDTGWYSYAVTPEGVPTDSPIGKEHPLYGALVLAPARLAEIPLKSLIRAQFGASNRLQTIQDEEIPKVDLEKWARMAVINQMGWSKSLTRLWQPLVSDGTAFERFIGACLAQAGVTQVASGVKALSDTGDLLLETDVIAFHGDRMIFVDIKLSNESGKTDRIRSIHATAERYGGLSARAVVLRPNWPVSSTTQVFSQALGVGMVNSGNRADMIGYLLNALGLGPADIVHTATAKAVAALRGAKSQQWQEGMRHRHPPVYPHR